VKETQPFAQPTSDSLALSVTTYATALARAVRAVGGAVVEGEVQKPRRTPSGMLCFDLTDGDAKLACKVFRTQVARLEHPPEHGDLVQVAVERPDFWAVAGKLDLIVTEVRLAGEGELLRRRAELLRKLEREGLCDPRRRKPLPRFPRAVGVVAGQGSDGMSDVVRALQDRFPPIRIVTCPSLVQGKAAPRDLIDALACLQDHPLVDVIVIARGGGSVQDLVAFDDERLCRALFACDTPVVTAIGHTENVPVCNHVAHAAYTPSRSAELVVPSIKELRQDLRHAELALASVSIRLAREADRVRGASGHGFDSRAFFGELERELDVERSRLVSAPSRLDDARTGSAEQGRRLRVGIRRQLLDHERDYGRALERLVRETKAAAARRLAWEADQSRATGERLQERIERRMRDAARDLCLLVTSIDARDFRRQGYVLATGEDGRPLPSVSGIGSGDRLTLTFRDGRAGVVVDQTEETG
jgi:exodeoxyribonuclease VII large subunit